MIKQKILAMKGKGFLKFILWIACLSTGFLFLFARSGEDLGTKEKADYLHKQAVPEDTAAIDMSEGLAILDKIARRYEGANLRITGEILCTERNGTQVLNTEKTYFVSINTQMALSYEVDSVQSVLYPDVMIIIDKREKSMVLLPAQTNASSSLPAGVMALSIAAFRDYISFIEVTKQGADHKLTIQFKEDSPANTNSYEIIYDPQSYRIMKVQMEIVNPEMTGETSENEADELVYTDEDGNEISTGYYATLSSSVYEVIYSLEENATEDMIRKDLFLKKIKNDFQPAARYSAYELTNELF